jgi:hypothetical protein
MFVLFKSPDTGIIGFRLLSHNIELLNNLFRQVFGCIVRQYDVSICNDFFLNIVSIVHFQYLAIDIHFLSIFLSSIDFNLHEASFQFLVKVFPSSLP